MVTIKEKGTETEELRKEDISVFILKNDTFRFESATVGYIN